MSSTAKDIEELTRSVINIFAEETKADNYITPDIAKETYRKLNNFLFRRLGANPSSEDMFRQLFSMQNDYDQRVYKKLLKHSLFGKYYPSIIDSISLPIGKEPTFKDLPNEVRITLLMSALIGEAKETQEALGLLPEFGAKWWKENVNTPLVIEELMDCFHFLLSAFLNAGMTPDEVFEEYYRKWLINHKRQDNNY